jgi:hypothetical protein
MSPICASSQRRNIASCSVAVIKCVCIQLNSDRTPLFLTKKMPFSIFAPLYRPKPKEPVEKLRGRPGILTGARPVGWPLDCPLSFDVGCSVLNVRCSSFCIFAILHPPSSILAFVTRLSTLDPRPSTAVARVSLSPLTPFRVLID